jgi:hypothetical protein
MEGGIHSNTLFEELISRYKKVVKKAEDMIVQQVCGEIEAALKVHFTLTTSASFPFLMRLEV